MAFWTAAEAALRGVSSTGMRTSNACKVLINFHLWKEADSFLMYSALRHQRQAKVPARMLLSTSFCQWSCSASRRNDTCWEARIYFFTTSKSKSANRTVCISYLLFDIMDFIQYYVSIMAVTASHYQKIII
jgi:hypothetical protein